VQNIFCKVASREMVFVYMSVGVRKWWISVYFKARGVTVLIQSITSVAYNNSVLNLVWFGVKPVWKQHSHTGGLCVATFALVSQSGTLQSLK